MPDWLIAWFRDGTVIALAVAILVVEMGFLLWRYPAHRGMLFNALSGIALMLALWGALAEPRAYVWIAACLAAGFAAHLADLIPRLRSAGSRRS